ncbi:unnamed protein product, partial [Iphiclides podalirius]
MSHERDLMLEWSSDKVRRTVGRTAPRLFRTRDRGVSLREENEMVNHAGNFVPANLDGDDDASRDLLVCLLATLQGARGRPAI